jgi:hypothetical protein
MNLALVVVFMLQIGGTPIADGTVIVSDSGIQFPDLPEGTTPVPINEDWELLYYEVATTSNQYIIRGEIRNSSPNPLQTPTLIVTISAAGAVQGAGSGPGVTQIGIHPDIDQVDAGGRAPFQYSVYEDDLTVLLNQSPELRFTGVCEHYQVIPRQEFSWEFTDVEIDYDAGRSAVQVSGTVTNVGDATAEYYAPMLFGFTADGQYVDSISSRDAPQSIVSGDSFAFEMNHGFDSYHSSEPFSDSGRDAIFVLAMAPPVYVSLNCVG